MGLLYCSLHLLVVVLIRLRPCWAGGGRAVLGLEFRPCRGKGGAFKILLSGILNSGTFFCEAP